MHVLRCTLGRALRPLNLTVVLFGCWYVCSGVILNYGSVCCGYDALGLIGPDHKGNQFPPAKCCAPQVSGSNLLV